MRVLTFALLASIGGMCFGSMSVAIFSYSSIPPCAHTCLSDLFTVASDFINMQNTTQNFTELCTAYENASLCVDEQEDCAGSVLFDTVFGGLEMLCNEQEGELEPHADCLANSTDTIVQNCDSNCMFIDTIMELSNNEIMRRFSRIYRSRNLMWEELAPVCTAVGCMGSCVAKGLNDECGEPAGTIVVESVLRPFFKSAAILEELGPRAKTFVQKQMPEECRFLVDAQLLQNITEGMQPEEMESTNSTEIGGEGSSTNSTEIGGEGSSMNSTEIDGEEGGTNNTESSSDIGGGGQNSKKPMSWRPHPLAYGGQTHGFVIVAKRRSARSPMNSASGEAVRSLLLGQEAPRTASTRRVVTTRAPARRNNHHSTESHHDSHEHLRPVTAGRQ
ncbi:CPG4 domain-containing protein [Trichostrongylus colubriformis]|uniref:CPG4 domain-containing protein n=1 Tax=Trichostrongylus colubriformis TaxID=6319 RepID=A0AAN8FG77_TRICO